MTCNSKWETDIREMYDKIITSIRLSNTNTTRRVVTKLTRVGTSVIIIIK